ncbi:methionine--tRNA ligase [bacterium]|nr:methionine--tRNA ligase [bacterium]
MDKFYITTAIDYVNGAPHIGHAYEKILTDVIFRHFTQRCDNCFFLTGVDEHGIKIQKTAAKNGITPQELCDKNASKFRENWKLLNVDYNKFIRTTDKDHEKISQQIFEYLLKKGDIYKNQYKGLYCNGCEAFLSEKDLTEDGLCPIHQCKPEEVSEENYFFKLTKYKERIAEYIKNHEGFIVPSFRTADVLNQLANIEDISVSRAKSNVSWGVDVLSDPDQIIYVWIDALSNYITALGYDTENPSPLFREYWPASVQVIGKDILKFHAIYWPALLMALDLPLPEHLLVHGWITIDEAKMSKSLGNVISPESILNNYELKEPDAFRYYMATAAPCGKDGNYSDEDFKEKVNAHLANSMGNLLNRTLSMLVKYFNGDIKSEFIVESDLISSALETVKIVENDFDNYDVQNAGLHIIELVDKANKYITDSEPWTLMKNGEDVKCGQVLTSVLDTLCIISSLIYPFCPNIAKNMAKQLLFDITQKLDDLSAGNIKSGHLIDKENIVPVFLRIDSEFAQKTKS